MAELNGRSGTVSAFIGFFIFLVAGGAFVLVRACPAPHPDVGGTVFEEAPKRVLIRLYANTPSGDVFMVVAEDKTCATVTENEWYDAIIGHTETHLWYPCGGGVDVREK